MPDDPFHEGERRVQQRVGVLAEAESLGPMIAPRIPAGAIPFVNAQTLLVLATLHQESLWCLPMVGAPGWMSASPQALTLDLTRLAAPADTRILHAASAAAGVGAVVLDFATRRRLRINGNLHQPTADRLVLEVREAYPNCPKYITQRNLTLAPDPTPGILAEGAELSPDQRQRFALVDALFIASQHAARGLDASHRGGNPGFVTSPDPHTLSFADYVGNNMFNTFGNLEVDPRIGLLLPDFERHSALAISGKATVQYQRHAQSRQVVVTIEQWQLVALPLQQTVPQLSPYNP